MRIVLNNRRVYHNYEVLNKYEAGIVLCGTEIKSIRGGKFNVNHAFCRITPDLQLHILQMYVSEYHFGNRFNHDPLRPRQLLMHKNEIRRLYSKVKEKGFSIMPLRFYFKKQYLKVEISLCLGKKLFDKRQSLKKKDAQKELDRMLKNF